MKNPDTNVEFRAANFADLPAVIALLANDPLGSTREDMGPPVAEPYLMAFKAIEADANQLLAVAVTKRGEVVGTLQISFLPGISRMGSWRGQIEAVRVAETQRNTGLGQKMFEWAILRCRQKGCQLVQLTTDRSRPDAHRFYENLGFVDSHMGYKMPL